MMISSMINQVAYISDTITQLLDYIDEQVFSKHPIEDKMSVWELCVHITQIPQADLLIYKGYNADQMQQFYAESQPVHIESAKEQFLVGIQEVTKHLEQLTEESLSDKFTTYWASEYRIGEWFLQIINHLVHHRMQLYTYLLVLKRDVQVVLFR